MWMASTTQSRGSYCLLKAHGSLSALMTATANGRNGTNALNTSFHLASGHDFATWPNYSSLFLYKS